MIKRIASWGALLVLLNGMAISTGHTTLGVAVDVGLALFAAAALLGTRIWPERIWIRRD